MIRHLRPTDTTALLPFRHAAGPAQAFTVAGALQSALQGFPATKYIALALSMRAWRTCWVDADDDGVKTVVRVGSRNSPSAWEIRDFFTGDQVDERCAEILGTVGVVGARSQVTRVFLRTEHGSWLVGAARRAGFDPSSLESLYVLAHGIRKATSNGRAYEGIRERAPADDTGLFRLYCASAPVEVRAKSGMTASEWWAALEKVWRRPQEVVVDRSGEIVAWLRHGPVQGWWYFSIIAKQTAVEELPDLIRIVLDSSAGRPIATLVAAYDTTQAAVLERLGFAPERKFNVMTQVLAARVRQPKGVVVATS